MAGRRCLLLLLLACWIAPACPLAATEDPTPATSPTPLPPPIGAPVTFAEETLFSLYDQLGPFTTQERAQAITERLSRLAKDSFSGVVPIRSADRELTSEVVLGETVIMTVTEGDAAPTGLTRQELAKAYALKIQTALTPPAPLMDLRSLLFSILWTLLATILLIGIWHYLTRLFPRIYSKLESGRNIHIRTFRVQNVDVLSADVMTNGLIWAARGIHITALVLLLYFYISAVFSFFPRTKGLAITLLGYLMSPLQATGQFHEAVVAIFFGILFTILITILLIIAARVLQQIYVRIIAALKSWRGTRIRSLKIQRVEILSADHIVEGLLAATRGIRLIVIVLALYFYASSVLGFFPWTRGVSALLFGYVLSSVVAVATALAGFIPNLISIVVIVVVTRYIIKLIHLVFTGIERGAVTFSGFQREWARPTYKIIRFLVTVFAVIAAFPYIPGSQSEGFRGISVFLGVLLSFGSAGAISNIIAGVVLTYMNPFQPGDRVKIADTFGDITEKTLLVTRVRTIKNVDITIPNALVLSSHIINYSSSAKTAPALILHTKVTIGYDAPWRKVHELLIAAARATTHILETPEPFVLQTSLDDFFVTYEINAYTDQPNKMANIYAELHQNIQDKFNEAGVEIMSPHYGQIRDGNQTTIPEDYLPKSYQAPAFRIGPLGDLFGGSKHVGTGKGEPQP
jgi:small-conductance mechanosensitive channel